MKKYDENSIEVLEDLEHIRRRPGMYIGTIDHTGIFQLLKECVDNSVDEYLAGKYATYIQVYIDTENHTFRVADNGRGIPLGKHPKTGISTLTTVLTSLQAGGKFNSQAYAISAGLHGVGLKATNALSAWLDARVWKGKKCYVQSFHRGKYTKKPARDPENDGKTWSTHITFRPDPLIFKEHRIDVVAVRKWLQETSHLCPGLKIELIVDEESEVFVSGGLGQLISEQALANKVELSHDPIVYTNEDNTIQIALAWALQDEDTVGTGWWSFVNASSTREHGTHVLGVKNAIAESLKTYTKTKLDLRDLTDGLYAAVHVLVKEPQFKSQIKGSLLNSEVTDTVYTAVWSFLKAYFDSNKQTATKIVERATQLKDARESYKRKRNAINKITIKKGARGLLPDKLAEAPFCKAEDRELFIVEGDSAGGGARKARNADFQEILPLRGKIPNSARWSVEKLLDNKEIAAMLTAIGAKITGEGKSNDLNKMRVGKVMLLMDADEDGDHIVSLVLTFFAVWLPELIEHGMIYVVNSPLFVGIYKDNHYFGDTLKDLTKQSGVDTSKMQVSRLKGHGECLSGCTHIFTHSGIKQIQQIAKHVSGFSCCNNINVSSITQEKTIVDKTFCKENAELFRIETRYGYNIIATKNHKFRVIRDGYLCWVPLSELENTDFIAMDRRGTWTKELVAIDYKNTSVLSNIDDYDDTLVTCKICGKKFKKLNLHIQFKHNITLHNYCKKYNVNKIETVRLSASRKNKRLVKFNIPTHVTPELGRILGYVVGDGSIHDYGVTVYHGIDEDSAIDNEYCLHKVFPGLPIYRSFYITDNNVKVHVVSYRGINIRNFLEWCGFSYPSTAYNKKIPDIILKSPKIVVANFLKAYFECYGWSEGGGYKVGLYTASKILAEQIRILLLNFGIICKGFWKDNILNPFTGKYTSSGIKLYIEGKSISTFYNEIGFISKRKNNRIYNKKHNTNDDVIPGLKNRIMKARDSAIVGKRGTNRYYTINGIEKLSFGIWTLAKDLTYEVFNYKFDELCCSLAKIRYNDIITDMEEIKQLNPFWDKVLCITPVNSNSVYDLNVPDGHSYTANGFIVHNCNYQELQHYAMNPETRKLWKVEYTEDDHNVILSLMGAESEARKVLLGI